MIDVRTLFDGETYDEDLDAVRLARHLNRVFIIMRRGDWLTLKEIRREMIAQFQCYATEAAISARLRDFRKSKFGAMTVDRRRRGDPKAGLFEYRLATGRANG